MKRFYLLFAATLEIIHSDPYFKEKEYQLYNYLGAFGIFQVMILFLLLNFFKLEKIFLGFDNYAFILFSVMAFIGVHYIIKPEDINATRKKIENMKSPKSFAYFFHVGVWALHIILLLSTTILRTR